MNSFFFLVLPAVVILLLAMLYRRSYGFGSGETISMDKLTLRSERYRLVGRPDRIVRKGKQFIPEDKKSGRRVYDSHRLQMGVYMLLVEEHFGSRPKHAVVVLGNGKRVKVANSPQLRQRVLEIAGRIRDGRRNLHTPQPGIAHAAKCRACGQRDRCTQRVA